MPRILFSLLVVLGIGIRIGGLDARSLWLDEVTSIEIASKSLLDIVQAKGFDAHTPPAYYTVLNVWLSIFGTSATALRSFSLLLEIVCIGLLFYGIRRHFSLSLARSVTALYLLNPYALYYAQEGRMYTMLTALVLGTFFIACELSQATGKRFITFLLASIATLGLYTHYYYALSLAGISTAFFFNRDVARAAKIQLLISLAVAGVAFLPWIPTIFSLAGGSGQTFREHTWLVLPYTAFRFLAGYGVMPLTPELKANLTQAAALNLSTLLFYGIACIALFGLSIVGLFAATLRNRALALGALLFPPLAALLVSLKTPMLSERYLIVCLPFVLLLAAAGIHARWKHWWAQLATALLVLSFTVGVLAHYLNPQFGNTQWREACAYLEANAYAGEVIVANPNYIEPVLRYYLKKPIPISHDVPERAHVVWLMERGTTSSQASALELKGYVVTQVKRYPLENGIRLFRATRSESALE